MKIKRYKKIRKLLHYYDLNHSIKPPYTIILDGEFLQAAKEGKIMVKDQLGKFLQQEEKTHVYITKCTIQHLKELGKEYGGALFIALTMNLIPCNHHYDKKHVKQTECIQSLVSNNNENKYIIGAQSLEIRSLLRNKLNIPILFIRGSVPIMEKPNDFNKTLTIKENIEKKTTVNEVEKKLIEKVIAGEKQSDPSIKPLLNHRKKKAKGPNPLSMKKKQKQPQNQQKSNKDQKTVETTKKTDNKDESKKKSSVSSTENSISSTQSVKFNQSKEKESKESTSVQSSTSSVKNKRKRNRTRKNKSSSENNSNSTNNNNESNDANEERTAKQQKTSTNGNSDSD